MSEDRLELEQELLLTRTKAQMINKYIDELEENEILTKQWLKTKQELERYKNIVDELERYINENKYQDTWGDTVILVGYLLDKLKELKGE